MPIRGERLRWPPRPGRRSTGTRARLATDSTDEQQPNPRQPNEHDESADSQAGGPRPIIQQAHKDLVAGREDTDCRNSAGEVIGRNTERSRRRRQ